MPETHEEPCKGLIEFKGDVKGDMKLIRNEMKHSSELLKNAVGEIAGCVDELKDGTKVFTDVQQRLELGNLRFISIEKKVNGGIGMLVGLTLFVVSVHGEAAIKFLGKFIT